MSRGRYFIFVKRDGAKKWTRITSAASRNGYWEHPQRSEEDAKAFIERMAQALACGTYSKPGYAEVRIEREVWS